MSKPSSRLWDGDEELFRLARRELFTAVVGDILDQMGFLNQFLPPQVRPLAESMTVIGRAMPVLEADIAPGKERRHGGKLLRKPFGLMLQALDDLKPGEIYLCSGASSSYALWGELMSTRAMMLGAAGVVLDGYTRDSRATCAMKFPTFCRGAYAQDQAPRGHVIDFRVPLKIGALSVRPGDILFGDIDGVCAVPRHVEREVFTRAFEKARGEKLVRKALLSGMSATTAFQKFGIL